MNRAEQSGVDSDSETPREIVDAVIEGVENEETRSLLEDLRDVQIEIGQNLGDRGDKATPEGEDRFRRSQEILHKLSARVEEPGVRDAVGAIRENLMTFASTE